MLLRYVSKPRMLIEQALSPKQMHAVVRTFLHSSKITRVASYRREIHRSDLSRFCCPFPAPSQDRKCSTENLRPDMTAIQNACFFKLAPSGARERERYYDGRSGIRLQQSIEEILLKKHEQNSASSNKTFRRASITRHTLFSATAFFSSVNELSRDRNHGYC